MIKTKVCKGCGIKKPLSEFQKDKYLKDDHKNKCKKCIKKYSKQYYKNNKELILDYSKNYKEIHKEELREKRKQRYLDNRDKELEYNRIYRENNKNKEHKRNKEWRSNIIF